MIKLIIEEDEDEDGEGRRRYKKNERKTSYYIYTISRKR